MEKTLLLRHFRPTLLVIDVQEKLLSHMFNRDEIVRNLSILIRGLRIMETRILVFEQNPKGMGSTAPIIQDALDDCYKPIDKMSFSALGDEKTATSIGERRDDTYLLLTGIESHVCVLQTALALREKDFRCGVLVDCVGSRTEKNYHFAIERMKHAGVGLLTTEMVLFEMMHTASHPRFREILNLVK